MTTTTFGPGARVFIHNQRHAWQGHAGTVLDSDVEPDTRVIELDNGTRCQALADHLVAADELVETYPHD